jgi:hypothetical protein
MVLHLKMRESRSAPGHQTRYCSEQKSPSAAKPMGFFALGNRRVRSDECRGTRRCAGWKNRACSRCGSGHGFPVLRDKGRQCRTERTLDQRHLGWEPCGVECNRSECRPPRFRKFVSGNSRRQHRDGTETSRVRRPDLNSACWKASAGRLHASSFQADERGGKLRSIRRSVASCPSAARSCSVRASSSALTRSTLINCRRRPTALRGDPQDGRVHGKLAAVDR